MSNKKFQCRNTKKIGEIVSYIDPTPGVPSEPFVVFKYDDGTGVVPMPTRVFNTLFSVFNHEPPKKTTTAEAIAHKE